MIAKHKHVLFALVAVLIVVGMAANASAYCASCGVPAVASYSYAPAYTTAYAPTSYSYTTAYAPVYTSGWYPGYYWNRMRMNWWNRPAYTTAYAPATYSAGYASTAYYAPSYSYASYAPGCSSCGTCSSCTSCYTPACSTCTAAYVPACTGCATGCSDCAGATTVTQAVYTEPAAPCTNCAPAASTITISAPAASTYAPPSTSQPQPSLAPAENPPAERTYETEKPVEEAAPIEPVPQAEATEESAKFEAPQLLSPNDRTAERHQAPVWTAVYHKPVTAATNKVHGVSHRQAEADADGWVSASE